MIATLVKACAEKPAVTLLLALVCAGVGVGALTETSLDAVPDLSDTQVIVFTEWPGQSPQLVEDQVTRPISTLLRSSPRAQVVRGQSFLGLSFVYVIFEDGTDLYWARARVLEALSGASVNLPPGVRPTLGPDATGVGWVYQYALVDQTGARDLASLRTLHDVTVKDALASVPGVAEVASVGGFVRQLQVQADPVRMEAHGVSIQEVARASAAANGEVSARVLELAGHEHAVRGRGYVRSAEDLRVSPVAMRGDESIRVHDVAEVTLGPELRRGVADLDGNGEVVGGIVVMRSGENALKVIARIKERVKALTLPDGVEVVTTYDRSELIEESVSTLKVALVEEMAVVAIVILLFLLSVRSALIPILTLPLGVLLAFVPMVAQGITANIMSLGGIAIAIGAMVDAAIVVIENVHQKLGTVERDALDDAERRRVTIEAIQEVAPSVFFSLLVITVSFLPVFALTGTEGRLFSPLAYTKTYSMGFAAVLSVTVVPALVALLVRDALPEDAHPLSRCLTFLYAPVVRVVVRYRVLVFALALIALVLTLPLLTRIESEFMPPLFEGDLLYMPSAPPGMSVEEARRVMTDMDRRLSEVPEVARVFGKMGRAETATDPAPLSMAEITIRLKPRHEWRAGLTYDALIAELDELMQYPGMPNVWWMPIQTRTEMLATGVRAPLGIKVLGEDLTTIARAATQIESALTSVPGTRSAFAERATGGFYLDVSVKREEAARFGLSAQDVLASLSLAVGGATVSETVWGRERVGIFVRYGRDFRSSPEALRDVLIETPARASGQRGAVPLSDVAEIEHVTGPPMIRSEDGSLLGFVFADTERPIAEYVDDVKRAIAELQLSGVRVEYAGQYRYLERAQARLSWVVPLTLLLVLMLLLLNTRSLAETMIVMLSIPFSLIGAFWILYLLGFQMSVAVAVGLIALAGLDAEMGVVMLLYLKLAWSRHEPRDREELVEAVVDGAARRVRPKLMTVLTTTLGLLPLLMSEGAGADVMKRIAAPMVGGLGSSFLMELLVYPALFYSWKAFGLRSVTQSSQDTAVIDTQVNSGEEQ